jgi:pimeloyl-ACP methyl ester carboxylesterase
MYLIRDRRTGRRLPVLLSAVVVASGLAVAFGLVSPAHASARSPHPAGTKPTIVLEHGAWADSSSWNAVVERLQALGYTVDVPPNPLTSLTSDSEYLSDFLSTISGPVVLVGHSYGGMVITNAATGDPNVKALVYVDAYIPRAGNTLLSLTTAVSGSCLTDAPTSDIFDAVPYPGGPSGDVELYVKQSVFPGCFANGLPPQEAAALAAEQRPLPASVLGEPSGTPAWQTIPSWAVIGLNDHVIPPAEQITMANDAGAHITEIPAPHLSMIADPGAVTAVIVQAAQSAG